jgi:hypothetical protein
MMATRAILAVIALVIGMTDCVYAQPIDPFGGNTVDDGFVNLRPDIDREYASVGGFFGCSFQFPRLFGASDLRRCRKCVQVDAAFRASVRYITF